MEVHLAVAMLWLRQGALARLQPRSSRRTGCWRAGSARSMTTSPVPASGSSSTPTAWLWSRACRRALARPLRACLPAVAATCLAGAAPRCGTKGVPVLLLVVAHGPLPGGLCRERMLPVYSVWPIHGCHSFVPEAGHLRHNQACIHVSQHSNA